MSAAEVIDAEYDAEREVVECTFETDYGHTATATFGKRFYGPDTVLSDEAMKKFAEQLPGTPMYDRTDGCVFDEEDFSRGLDSLSIGWDTDE